MNSFMKWEIIVSGQGLEQDLTYLVGNKRKRRISKRVFQENKVHQIFRKPIISNPLIRTRMCAYQGVRNVCFSQNLMRFFRYWKG